MLAILAALILNATCAECTHDCDAACGVAACTSPDESGCWMPEDFDTARFARHAALCRAWCDDDRGDSECTYSCEDSYEGSYALP